MIEYDEYELDHKAKPNDIDEESEKNDYSTSTTILFFLIVVVITLLILIIPVIPIIFARNSTWKIKTYFIRKANWFLLINYTVDFWTEHNFF